jgi:hypothetical protein
VLKVSDTEHRKTSDAGDDADNINNIGVEYNGVSDPRLVQNQRHTILA